MQDCKYARVNPVSSLPSKSTRRRHASGMAAPALQSGRAAAERKYATAEDFGAPPPPGELERRWALVERDFGSGVGGPEGLGLLSDAQKWQLVVMYGLSQARREEEARRAEEGLGEEGALGAMLRDDDDLKHFMHSPTRWLDRLRDHQVTRQ